MKAKVLILVLSVFLFTGCTNNNSAKNMTTEDINKAISNVSNVTETCIATEENDPNNLMNKPGGYIGLVYFTDDRAPEVNLYDDVTYEEREAKDTCEKGVAAGGVIEIFKNKDEAKKRNDYLSNFDGSVFGNYHELYNHMVIRITDELTATEQKDLKDKIVSEIDKNNK